MARSWVSLGAVSIYLPTLAALWSAKSARDNLALLAFANAMLLVAAFGSRM
jgi:hypothetical protein